MNSYCITNLMNMSVIIEDIHVRLPCKGSSMVINADVMAKSRDLKTCRNWVDVKLVSRSKPMPIWPLVKPALFFKSETQSTSPPIVQPSSELDEVRQSLRKIEQSTKAMLDLLAYRSLSPEVIQQQPQFKDSQLFQESQVPPMDPIYIPKTMVSKDAEISMHTNKGEMSIDLDAVTAALRNARKR